MQSPPGQRQRPTLAKFSGLVWWLGRPLHALKVVVRLKAAARWHVGKLHVLEYLARVEGALLGPPSSSHWPRPTGQAAKGGRSQRPAAGGHRQAAVTRGQTLRPASGYLWPVSKVDAELEPKLVALAQRDHRFVAGLPGWPLQAAMLSSDRVGTLWTVTHGVPSLSRHPTGHRK
jgi:hypothetical protein